MNDSRIWRQQRKLAVVAAAVAVAFASSAQQEEPERENANRPQTNESTPSTQIARSDTAMQSLEQYLQSNTLRVSKLVGMDLQTRTDDDIGEVRDVIRGTTPGQDMQLVVQVAGGADEKLVAIPFDELQIGANGD